MPDMPDRKAVTIPYEHALDQHSAHAQAALEFCEKHELVGTLVSGSLDRGYVFVFRDNSFENLIVTDGE
jgi:hypothetical protein